MGYLAIRKRLRRVQSTRAPITNSKPIQSVPTLSKEENPKPEREGDKERLFDARWFLENKDRLPSKPFRMSSAIFVCDPPKYFDSLEAEINGSISNYRIKTGALQSDLVRLRRILST